MCFIFEIKVTYLLCGHTHIESKNVPYTNCPPKLRKEQEHRQCWYPGYPAPTCPTPWEVRYAQPYELQRSGKCEGCVKKQKADEERVQRRYQMEEVPLLYAGAFRWKKPSEEVAKTKPRAMKYPPLPDGWWENGKFPKKDEGK